MFCGLEKGYVESFPVFFRLVGLGSPRGLKVFFAGGIILICLPLLVLVLQGQFVRKPAAI